MSQRVTRQSARIASQTPPDSKSSEKSLSKDSQENQEEPANRPPPPPPPPPVPLSPLEVSLFQREEQIRASIIHTAASIDLGPEWITFQQQLLESLLNPRPPQDPQAIQRDKLGTDQDQKKMGDQSVGQDHANQEIKEVIPEKSIQKKRVHKLRRAHPSLQTQQVLVQAQQLEFESPPPPWSSIDGVYIKDVGVQVNLEQPQPLKVLDIYNEEGEEVIKVRYRDREFLCSRAYMEQRHIRSLIEYYEELMYTQHVISKQKRKKRKDKEKDKEKEKEKEKEGQREGENRIGETVKPDEQKVDTSPKASLAARNKKSAEGPSRTMQLEMKRRSVRLEQSDSISIDSKKKKH